MEVAGSSAGRLHTNDDSHWLRQFDRANENRVAHVPRPLGPLLDRVVSQKQESIFLTPPPTAVESGDEDASLSTLLRK